MISDLARPAARFVRAVALLSLTSQMQIEWLSSLGLGEPGACDELALEFDDGFKMINAFIEADIVPKKALDSLQLLDRRLGKMSGPENASLWTLGALETSPEWKEVRELAGRCLRDLY